MYGSSLSHIHDPVLLSQDRNYIQNLPYHILWVRDILQQYFIKTSEKWRFRHFEYVQIQPLFKVFFLIHTTASLILKTRKTKPHIIRNLVLLVTYRW